MPCSSRWFLIAPLVLVLAACADPAPAPVAEAPAAPVPPARIAAGDGEVVDGQRRFGAKRIIRIRLSLLPTASGGRATSLQAGYRPTVRFTGEAPSAGQVCAIRLGDLEAFAPGETHDVTMRCTAKVAFAPDAPGFVLLEDGREVGQGIVLP